MIYSKLVLPKVHFALKLKTQKNCIIKTAVVNKMRFEAGLSSDEAKQQKITKVKYKLYYKSYKNLYRYEL